MSRRLKQVLNIVFFMGIGLLLTWLTYRSITPAQKVSITDAIEHANYWLILPAMIIGIFSHFFRAARWNIIIEPLGYKPRLLNSFFSVMVGYLVNLGLPRVGEISRCAVLARYEKIPAEKLIGTLIAERAVDVVCLLLLMLATVFSQLALLSDLFYTNVWQPVQHKFAHAHFLVYIIVILVLLVLVFVLRWLFRKLQDSKVAIKIKAMARGVMDGLLSIGKMKHKWRFILYTLLIWLAYFSMLYCGFFCLPATSGLGLKAAMAVLSMGSIAMIITPGGLGAYPPMVKKTLLLYGIEAGMGLAFGMIIWLAQTVLIITLGLISFICLPVFNKERKAA